MMLHVIIDVEYNHCFNGAMLTFYCDTVANVSWGTPSVLSEEP